MKGHGPTSPVGVIDWAMVEGGMVAQVENKPRGLSGFFSFLSGFSFMDTDNTQDSRGKEGTIFYSTLPLPPTHEHSDIHLQLYMWEDYHIF